MAKIRHIAIFALLFFAFALVHAGETRPAWQIEWEKTLQAAKREGKIIVYASSGFEAVLKEFQKRYPEIKVSFAGGGGARDAPKIMAEHRAKKFSGDILISGIVTPNRVYYPANLLAPIRPVLILPEVLDESRWWEGKHHYADGEATYVFVFQGNVHGGENAYNTKLIDPREFKSYWDFLRPKWKGKIIAFHPIEVSTVAHSLRYFYHHPEIGPEFIKRFLSEADLTFSRDNRQMIDWLGSGKFSIAFFVSGVEDAARQGLPVKMFEPGGFKEGAFVGPTLGSLSLFRQSPHLNAAKVAINWLLSREGQTTFQNSYAEGGDFRESMREDIPKDVIPPSHRRAKGTNYIYSGRPEWILGSAELRKLVNEALGMKK